MKKGKDLFNNEFSRRTFLKGSAAAASVAGIAAMGSPEIAVKRALADEGDVASVDEEKIYQGTCRGGCETNCVLKVKVRNGKVVQTEAADMPDKRYNRICIKGLSHPHRIYHPDRIKYPMKRVGERGAGQWEQISWEEATQTIADTWTELIKKYGNSSIAHMHGSGNTDAVGTNATARLFTHLKSSVVTQSVDQALLMWSLHTLGAGELYNGNEWSDYANAKTILLWASNYAETHVQSWHFIADAIDNGATVIAIDPNYNITSSKATIHVPIRPATDAALAMAMCNIVINEDYADWDFIKKSTVGPFLVKENDGTYLRLSDLGRAEAESEEDAICVRNKSGEVGSATEIDNPVLEGKFVVDGIKVTTAYSKLVERISEWTPEKASKLCDIPVDTIYEITKIYATQKPGSLIQGYGYDHYTNGHTACFAMMTLAMLTGNLGKHGATAIGESMRTPGVVNSALLRGAADFEFHWLNENSVSIPPVVFWDTVESGKFNGEPINLKSLYVTASNVFATFPDRKAWHKAADKMDLVVVADIMMSSTAQYADIVLPVTHWFEKEDIDDALFHPYVAIQEKAIEPLYESKTTFEISSMIAEKMGFGDLFNMTYDEYLESAFDDNPVAKKYGITIDSLREKKLIRAVSYASDGGPYVYGEDGVFGTETGRAQFYLEHPTTNADYGQTFDVERERLPYWKPPTEAWNVNAAGYEKKELANQYPLILFNQHTKWRTHTTFSYLPALREMDPEPYIYMNPKDAASRGIRKDDVVKVYNDRGHILIKARINSGLRPGMVNVPHGWQADQFIEGHYQDLTSRAHDPICVNNCCFDTLVEVEKV